MSTVVKTQVPRLNTMLESKLHHLAALAGWSNYLTSESQAFLISNTKIIKTASLVGFYDN